MKSRVSWLLPLVAAVEAIGRGVLPINELRQLSTRHDQDRISTFGVDLNVVYPAHTLKVPVDHFHNDSIYEPHSDERYEMRYWFDDTYYEEGGPVIVLCAGETNAEDRLPFLQKGIVYELSKATKGLGVILEHRYYGKSWPTADLTTENLRFLTTEQALADTAYFAEHVIFPGHEDQVLTSSGTPWIAYGGSYAGAFVAFLRKLYPEIFWGAISSSGVTKAVVDYSDYFTPIAEYGPKACIKNTQMIIQILDKVFMGEDAELTQKAKEIFNLDGITDDQDFLSVLTYTGIGGWQARNWDPAVGSQQFAHYCENVSSKHDLYELTAAKAISVSELLVATGYGGEFVTLLNPILNWIGYLQHNVVDKCAKSQKTLDECYCTHNQTFYDQTDLDQIWRAWPYQFCTQWGYFVTGSGVPPDQFPLISRTIDLNFTSRICRSAFSIHTAPNITSINKLGGLHFSYPRLAHICGEADPWRGATPLALEAQPWPNSTTSEPLLLIPGAVHHWDENGLFPNETTGTLPPGVINEVHGKEEEFVKAWLEEAKEVYPRGVKGGVAEVEATEGLQRVLV